MKKLAIIITHPIQYSVPLFQRLAPKCDLKVFFTWGEKGLGEKYDPGFKRNINWDIPMLAGYQYELLDNTAKTPGSHHYSGIKNPLILKKIIDFKPDAILVYGWAYHGHLKAIRYFKGEIPIWFRGDSNLLNEQNGIKKNLRKLFLTWLYQHIDIAFYVGSDNKEYYEKFGLKEHQLLFAPHAIDNNRFFIDETKSAYTLRKSLGINDRSILILFAGKLEQNKNPILLLKAFIDLNLADVHMLFVGNGALEEKLKRESLSKKSKENNIHFMDFQNQTKMPAIYQSCDLFCLPSQSETWGLVINEAMASGKAILVSDAVGCASDLVSKENGAIFKNDDLDELKNKLNLLCNNKLLLMEMGLNSKEIIKDWNIDLQSEIILKQLNK